MYPVLTQLIRSVTSMVTIGYITLLRGNLGLSADCAISPLHPRSLCEVREEKLPRAPILFWLEMEIKEAGNDCQPRLKVRRGGLQAALFLYAGFERGRPGDHPYYGRDGCTTGK